MEFGRAPECVCNVLAVLGDGEEAMWTTFRSAVELADAKRARLTLVKTCDPGRAYVWVAPFAAGGAYIPPELDSPEEAARLLAQVAEQVPAWIPVTTLVLGSDTQGSLLRLLQSGNYGALVAEACLLSRCRRVRRLLRREELISISVGHDSQKRSLGSIATQISSISEPKDGALDAEQVSEANGRGRLGLRPWRSRRLAGAGGEG